MKFGAKVKEKIARTIGDFFTTNEIVSIFTNANISTNVSLYAKWRIVVDAFSKISSEEGFFHIVGEFCHPLNFTDNIETKTREDFIKNLNNILSYEDMEILPVSNNDVRFISKSKRYEIASSQPPVEDKTATDYILDAINFFKDEYNKVKLIGLSYEYSLGENKNSDQIEGEDFYEEKLQAIEQLKNIGFITEYSIKEKVECDGYYVWDYAVCKIDESKMMQKEAPPATEAGVQALTKKIIHEHTHRFENSIQEKPIDLKHIYKENTPQQFYITRDGDDFKYKGKILNLSKDTDYYKVFSALYAKLPEGGEIKYKELISEIKSRIKRVENDDEEEMRKFIQRNLTDKSNGFMRYADISETEDGGKPLIKIIRGSGVCFNNKAK